MPARCRSDRVFELWVKARVRVGRRVPVKHTSRVTAPGRASECLRQRPAKVLTGFGPATAFSFEALLDGLVDGGCGSAALTENRESWTAARSARVRDWRRRTCDPGGGATPLRTGGSRELARRARRRPRPVRVAPPSIRARSSRPPRSGTRPGRARRGRRRSCPGSYGLPRIPDSGSGCRGRVSPRRDRPRSVRRSRSRRRGRGAQRRRSRRFARDASPQGALPMPPPVTRPPRLRRSGRGRPSGPRPVRRT